MRRTDEATYAAADRLLIDLAAEYEGHLNVIDALLADHADRLRAVGGGGLLPADPSELSVAAIAIDCGRRELRRCRTAIVAVRERRMARARGDGHG